MAFVRSTSPTYFAPATYSELDETGKLVASKFDCQFKRLSRTDLKALDAKVKGWVSDDVQERDHKLLGEVLIGWRGVQGLDGKEQPFSMEAATEIDEEKPGFLKCCVTAFFLSTAPTASAHLAAKN